jgi:hypothetical protein
MGARLTEPARAFRVRLLLAVICVAGTGLLCGCGGGKPAPAAFVPKGGATTSAAPSQSASTAAVPGLQNFAFPSSIKIQFQTPMPASGPQRSAVIAYENYIDSMWHAVYTHGADTSYKKYVYGNALSFVQTEIRFFTTGNYQLRGTITYYDTTVPQVFSGAGAVVSTCVDASEMKIVKPGTVGTLFKSSFFHYQEQTGTGKTHDGFWIVNHTVNTPATSGGTAGGCTG